MATVAAWEDAVLDLKARPGGGVVMVGRSSLNDGVAMAMAFDPDGNELWSETVDQRGVTGERFEEVVLMDGQAFAVGCGPVEWMSTYPQ